jgi:hypothetical protein
MRLMTAALLAAAATAGAIRPPPPPPPPPVVYGFRFATTHSDDMVLQAAPQRSIVWGFVPTSAPVKVCVGASSRGSGGSSTGNGVSGRPGRTAASAAPTCVDAAITSAPNRSDTAIFTATLPPMQPSATPHQVTATTAGHTPITLNGVVFGDVFVCSGQSTAKPTSRQCVPDPLRWFYSHRIVLRTLRRSEQYGLCRPDGI